MKPHQHLWVLDVLQPEGQRVLAVGDHNLAHSVSRFGFDTIVATDPDPCDVLLLSNSLDVGCDPEGRLLRPEAAVVAVLFPSHSRLFGFGLPGRAAVLASAPAAERRIRAKVDGARRRLEALGYRCRTMRIGNGFGPSELSSEHDVGVGLRDRPSGVVLIGHRSPLLVSANGSGPPDVAGDTVDAGSAQSVVAAVTEASRWRLGRRLDVDRVMAMSSEKVQVYASDPDSGEAFVISIGVGMSIGLLERSLAARRTLRERDLPDSVRERVIWPLVDGTIGPARYVIEPLAPGTQASRMPSDAIRDDCVEFIRDLFMAGADGSTADDAVFGDRLDGWCRNVSAYLEPSDVVTLSEIHKAAADRLGGVPLGFTHGDFWPGNIFKADGRLSAVIDWDDASPHGLPFTDALDLAATTVAGRGNVEPGPRVVEWLWPMIEQPRVDLGGLRPEDLGLSMELAPPLLGALAVAYWLERISRQLEFGYRTTDRRWVAANIRDPLAFIERELS